MVNNLSKKIIFFVTIIFFVNFISASFSNGNLNHLIGETYAPEGEINGWVNVSLSNEPTNSVLSSLIGSVQNNINLIDLIKKDSNSEFSYTCNPLDCNSDYSTSDSGEPSKIFNLNSMDSLIIGFKITSSQIITDVPSFSIKIASNNPESKDLPLAVDVLNDGQIDWKSNVSSNNFNDAQHGCYSEPSINPPAGIVSTQYCERLSLSQSPKVNISANVIGTGNVMFTMSIQDVNGSSSKSCTTPIATGSGEIGCIPSNFPVNNGNYFVCIKTTNSADANKYQIGYEQTNPCGFSGNYNGNYNFDFNIFAKTAKYDTLGIVTLNDPSIKNEIKDYLSTKYGDNCTNGCIIPIKFISGADQQVSVTEPSLTYFSGISVTEILLYNLDEIPAMINSGFQKLFLDQARFKVPDSYGNYTASLSLDGNNIFSDQISVGEVPTIKYLTPLKTAVKYPTKFDVIVNSTDNITSYIWDFGNGNNQTTKTNEIVYSYSESGTYKITVSAVDSSGRGSSKIFNVTVTPASEIVPSLLQSTTDNINSLQNQLSNFSDFEQRSINSLLKLNDTLALISTLKNSISDNSSETDYESVLQQLLNIKIPQSIEETTSSSNIIFYPQLNDINLNALTQITKESYSSGGEDAYKNAILAWDEANVDISLDYHEISAVYADYEGSLLKTFDMTITKKGDNTNSSYVIIKDLNDLFFSKNYSQQEQAGYTYLKLNDQKTNIVFSTTDNVDFVTLPLFVSPKISDLSVEGNVTPLQENSQRWITFGIIAGLIILAGLLTWFIIRMWYRKKYENYLFKNKNNLYNLVNFIDSEKKKGTSEKDIRSKLKKTGWNLEQVDYALKKYSGRKII